MAAPWRGSPRRVHCCSTLLLLSFYGAILTYSPGGNNHLKRAQEMGIGSPKFVLIGRHLGPDHAIGLAPAIDDVTEQFGGFQGIVGAGMGAAVVPLDAGGLHGAG